MKERKFTIRDLLAAITIVAVLLALMLPLVRDLTESSRRSSCKYNAKEILLAIHNYHSAYRCLPSAMAGTDDNANRLSGMVALTPFCESQAVWEEIYNPRVVNRVRYPSMGPLPWDKKFAPWKSRIPCYHCPSDPRPSPGPFGNTNFVFCIGDSVTNIHAPKPISDVRGLFSPRVFTRFRDTLDGLSNTIAISEVASLRERRLIGQFATNMPATLANRPSDCLKTIDPKKKQFYAASIALSDLGRGGNWADGAGGYALMQTILPPNSPSCAIGGTAEVDGIYSASSRHAGGCHVGMADGAIVFMTNTIDTGDLSAPAPMNSRQATRGKVIKSPYGLWGALGTRASNEAIVDAVDALK